MYAGKEDRWLCAPERLKLILPRPLKGCLKSESESRRALLNDSGKQKVRLTLPHKGEESPASSWNVHFVPCKSVNLNSQLLYCMAPTLAEKIA